MDWRSWEYSCRRESIVKSFSDSSDGFFEFIFLGDEIADVFDQLGGSVGGASQIERFSDFFDDLGLSGFAEANGSLARQTASDDSAISCASCSTQPSAGKYYNATPNPDGLEKCHVFGLLPVKKSCSKFSIVAGFA